MTDCLDTGTIQAFLDGELAPAESSRVSAHIAACDACAAQLAIAEEESAFVFSVLEREMDAMVPTQRLWSKINDSIETERQNVPFWKKAWAYITVSLANPSIAVAAGVLIVLGVSAVFFVERNKVDSPVAVSRPEVRDPSPVNTKQPGDIIVAAAPAPRDDKVGSNAASSPKPQRSPVGSQNPNVRGPVYVPGEESYIKTIASLSQTVNDQKGTVLRPSERIAYERDMAVVDDAIKKMRQEVRKNPKNDSAKQVLYTSYQNKIDLLNSVSQREELVASLKD
jgi:hypothetical protein